MGNLEDAFRDAAGEVAQIKARPSNRYWWLYGTIKAKNENGTLDVAIDGVTIQQVKATVSCMMADVGDRVVVLKAGPIMTCIDVISGSVQGTAYNTRNWLRLSSTPVTLERGSYHKAGPKVFLIGHSELPTNSDSSLGYAHILATWGGLSGVDHSEADVTFTMRDDILVFTNKLSIVGTNSLAVRKDSSGVLWFYLYTEFEYYTADVRAVGDQFVVDAKWQDSEPSGDLVWSSNNPISYVAHRNQLYSGMSIGTGLEASGKTLAANKSDLRKMLFSGDRVSTDLDSATPGVWEYNSGTKNNPNGGWGVCLVLWSAEDAAQMADWKFQLAFPTVGDPMWRRNINRGGWSSWWTMHTD